jgi:hypothetical protein
MTIGHRRNVAEMSVRTFRESDLATLSEALHVAEGKISDFFKFSYDLWKKNQYDVKTVKSLASDDISSYALAVLRRGVRKGVAGWKGKEKNFYFICLQDHQILKAVQRDRELVLLPFLTYIFTHELVHIARFGSFLQRYDVSGVDKEREEQIVHGITFDILKDLSLRKMDYVLDAYRDHRICEVHLS